MSISLQLNSATCFALVPRVGRFSAYEVTGPTSVAARHPEAIIIVPPRSNAVPSETAETEPTQHDRHLQYITKHGRMAWQSNCSPLSR